MPDFSEEEVTLMCLYHTGTRQGLIRELNDMLPYLAVDEMELRRITESVLQKLDGMTDRPHAAFCAEWPPEISKKRRK